MIKITDITFNNGPRSNPNSFSLEAELSVRGKQSVQLGDVRCIPQAQNHLGEVIWGHVYGDLQVEVYKLKREMRQLLDFHRFEEIEDKFKMIEGMLQHVRYHDAKST